MKSHIIIIAISTAFAFVACDTLNDPNSPLTKLGTQALSLGISQVTGKTVTAADLDGAAALIRSLAGKKTAPAPTEIKTAVASGTAQPSMASTLASKLSSYITQAISGGASHDAALETAAANLNKAAAATKQTSAVTNAP